MFRARVSPNSLPSIRPRFGATQSLPIFDALTFTCALKSMTLELRRTKSWAAPITWKACSQSLSFAQVPRTSRPSNCQEAPVTLKPSSPLSSSFAPRRSAARTMIGCAGVPTAEQFTFVSG